MSNDRLTIRYLKFERASCKCQISRKETLFFDRGLAGASSKSTRVV